jgi:hypothetical protein
MNPVNPPRKENTMKTLTKRNTTEIASLYNAIFVSESMMRKAFKKNETLDMDAYMLWRDSALDCVKTLNDKFGIKVIGY